MAHPANTPSNYISPLAVGVSFSFVPGTTIYRNVSVVDSDGIVNDSYYKIRITRPNGNIAFEQGFDAGSSGVLPEDARGYTEQELLVGSYIAYYEFVYPYLIPIPGNPPTWTIGFKKNTATYTFIVVENQLPLKRWTASDVISRVTDLAEPLRKGERPRFRLQGDNLDGTYAEGSQAALFDHIPSPEFAFTKQTLRENLRAVGEMIHGEPRLKPVKDGAGEWFFEITYDLYGQTERWKHAARPYVLKSVTQNVNTYASALDTHAENLVNKQTNYSGVIVEPYANGGFYRQKKETGKAVSEFRHKRKTRIRRYIGAGNGSRTRQNQLGKLTPYR